MAACCVRRCKSNSTVPFHRFPKNAERRIQWLQHLQITEKEPTVINKLRVCYKHFEDSDYSCSVYRKRLIDRAVPSIDIATHEEQQQDKTREISEAEADTEPEAQPGTSQEPQPGTSQEPQEAHTRICTDNVMLHEITQPKQYKRPYLAEVTRKRQLSVTTRRFYDVNIKLRKEILRLKKIIREQKKNAKSRSIALSTANNTCREDGTAAV